MIVRDEAAIIARCLAAAAPWIDAYAIHDTGSSDGTAEIVRSFLERRGVPGRVTHGRFDDFAQARNESLALARDSAAAYGVDYLLLCDADMELVVDDPGFRDSLAADAYLLGQRASGLHYANVRLLRVDAPARYVGVTHEYLDIGSAARPTLGGVWFHDHAEGANRRGKFERDLALLEGGLTVEPDNARYAFYRAQTLRDLGREREALSAYEHRASLGGWEEEVWYSLLQVALLRERLADSDRDVLAAYLAAFERRPGRAETLVQLARYLRELGRHELGHVFATRAVQLAPTDDILFVSPDCYGWRARDELSISSYWVGRYAESAALAQAVLADPQLPPQERPRVEQNLAFARERTALP
ncbi:Glycosyltransferase involved in cell wall bisynthesis [Nocardioides terrae]|uniref:Glycosyltransferase involved in cell wall bisynthesis n=2 Tax=Nocardioides terrae TaxID=574651 RepID=A0A1I1K859_9ACTN|nr:Glycosyltransferase involved in cell wall bisynthesis [Nocardioides terrae]